LDGLLNSVRHFLFLTLDAGLEVEYLLYDKFVPGLWGLISLLVLPKTSGSIRFWGSHGDFHLLGVKNWIAAVYDLRAMKFAYSLVLHAAVVSAALSGYYTNRYIDFTWY
jgi:hypothetical protein